MRRAKDPQNPQNHRVVKLLFQSFSCFDFASNSIQEVKGVKEVDPEVDPEAVDPNTAKGLNFFSLILVILKVGKGGLDQQPGHMKNKP